MLKNCKNDYERKLLEYVHKINENNLLSESKMYIETLRKKGVKIRLVYPKSKKTNNTKETKEKIDKKSPTSQPEHKTTEENPTDNETDKKPDSNTERTNKDSEKISLVNNSKDNSGDPTTEDDKKEENEQEEKVEDKEPEYVEIKNYTDDELIRAVMNKKRKTLYTSKVSELFGGLLLSEVTCLNCKKVSQVVDSFFDLSVSIPNSTERHAAAKYRKKRHNELKQFKATSKSPKLKTMMHTETCDSSDERNEDKALVDNDTLSSKSTDSTRYYSKTEKQEESPVEENSKWEVITSGLFGCFNMVSSFLAAGSSGLISVGTAKLKDCISHFCMPEKLTGDNKYNCEHCKGSHDAIKRFSILQLPKVHI